MFSFFFMHTNKAFIGRANWGINSYAVFILRLGHLLDGFKICLPMLKRVCWKSSMLLAVISVRSLLLINGTFLRKHGFEVLNPPTPFSILCVYCVKKFYLHIMIYKKKHSLFSRKVPFISFTVTEDAKVINKPRGFFTTFNTQSQSLRNRILIILIR